MTATLLTAVTRATAALRLAPRRCGWVGVDIGTRAVKLAQVERTGAGWRLAGRWTFSDEEAPPLTRELLLAGGLARQVAPLREVRRMFRGRQAAAALPMSLIALRALDLPTGPLHELRAMAEQELDAEDARPVGACEVDAWPTVSGPEMTKVAAVACERELSLRAAHDLLKSGLHCSVLDVIPCALARAVEMCDPASREEPVVALDLGYAATLLTIVRGGQPIFCRSFRGCGLQAMLTPLHHKMGINPAEARHLLTRYGIPATNESASAIGPAYQIVGRVLDHLADELRRTLQFVNQQMRISPARIWLLGGGATICNLPEFVSAQTDLPAATWRLAGSLDASEAMYAAAAGLSKLAWEAV